MGEVMKRTSVLASLLLGACADPCVDDGLVQDPMDAERCAAIATFGTDSGGSASAETSTTGTPTATDGLPTLSGAGAGSDDSGDTSEGGTESETDSSGGDPCANGIQDGDETDVDCGGSCPARCGDGDGCADGDDCDSGVCADDGTCAPPACDDGVQNGDETGVDCGGSCPACDDGRGCNEPSDCASGVCEDGVCQEPACDDGVQNGDETDVDCGGSCPACDDGGGCGDADDCVSGVCEDDVCQEPACDDGVRNGDESDVDCGGSCPGCDTGEDCNDGADCIDDVCNDDDECAPPLTVDAAPACSEFSGAPVPLTATAAGGTENYTYAWTPAATLDDATSSTPNATPVGFETYTVTVDDGVNQAQDTATVVELTPFDLAGNCVLYQGDFDGAADASITYLAAGTQACEEGNNDFGLHLCEGVVFEGVRLTAELTVLAGSTDDDYLGVVWGAQDAANFYSMSWKAADQDLGECVSTAGILVKRVHAADFDSITREDMYCPNDSAGSTFLVGPAGTTTAGWEYGEVYDVSIEFDAMGSHVEVVRQSDTAVIADFMVNDMTYTLGHFGSTTYSQENACVGPLAAECL